MMCNNYKIEMIPIIIGAFDVAPINLKTSLGNLNFDKKEAKSLTNYNRLKRCKNC